MPNDLVTMRFDEGVATVELNDPAKYNALSRDLVADLQAGLDAVEKSDARCVVVRGANGAFSAGGDVQKMKERHERDTIDISAEIRDLERTTSAVITRLATFPLPVVAAIDGPAVGAGATLALACDVQLASEDAKIGFSFRNVGLAIDSATSYLLPRVVGENVAKELVFTGEIVDADRALDLGLVNHVYKTDEFSDAVDEFVDTVASGPTVALVEDKKLIREGLEKSIDHAVTDEAMAQGIALTTADHEEGVEAFLEGRDPSFSGK
ncbi:enoyl-CoA hydratase/isomerase family protein [Natrarchaeobius chitinivorans]|nr:enoyl-CoA hydratase-related protein [Natrarchaeobius chitinivorans]